MGIQGFIVKLCLKEIDYRIGIMTTWCLAFLILFISQVIPAIKEGAVNWGDKWTYIALIPGLLAGIGTIILYQVVQNNEGSKIFPLTQLVVVVAAILSIIFLKEKITIRKIIGICCAIATGYFLLY
jgi:uncharacterized membrane protein